MAGLVEELQREALDLNVTVTHLVRRAKVVAVKLKLDNVIDWLDAELNGYDEEAVLPSYREQSGQSKWLNEYYNSWFPIDGPSSTMDILNRRKIRLPISTVEEFARRSDGEIYIPFSHEMIQQLFSDSPFPPSRAGVFFDRSRFLEIVELVRGKVLDWALDLERAGITGEGLCFSSNELQKASNVTIQIEQMHGTLMSGNVSGPNARANIASSDHSSNQIVHGDLFGDLKAAIESGVSGDERGLLLQALEDMKAAQGSKASSSAYQRFITSAANHMQIIAPFLPALTALLITGQAAG